MHNENISRDLRITYGNIADMLGNDLYDNISNYIKDELDEKFSNIKETQFTLSVIDIEII
jgi:hypothetical protein